MMWFAYCVLCLIFGWFIFFAPDRERKLQARESFTRIEGHEQKEHANLSRTEQCWSLESDQAKRLKELIEENSKLKRLVAGLSLEKQVLLDNQMLKNDRRNS